MLLIDSHLDLAMNALGWNRDLTADVLDIRRAEHGMAEPGRGRGTVAFPQMRQAELAVCVATVISRTARPGSATDGAATQEISYAIAQGQLAYYRVLAAQGRVRLITDAAGLQAHLADYAARPGSAPFGFVVGMEGADPIVAPDQVASWWADGLRVVSLAHYGISAYAHGTGTHGGLLPSGRRLLAAMAEVGMILDVTHLSEPAFWEALSSFGGPVLASHNNCRALVPGDRQFSDEQIRALVARGGVMGVALDAWMLYPDWVRGVTQPDVLTLDAVAAQIDHICQLAGDSAHAAIGSDLDGGYGTEQVPSDLDTIADLQKIPALLRARGYSEADCERIMHGNWARFFASAWDGVAGH